MVSQTQLRQLSRTQIKRIVSQEKQNEEIQRKNEQQKKVYEQELKVYEQQKAQQDKVQNANAILEEKVRENLMPQNIGTIRSSKVVAVRRAFEQAGLDPNLGEAIFYSKLREDQRWREKQSVAGKAVKEFLDDPKRIEEYYKSLEEKKEKVLPPPTISPIQKQSIKNPQKDTPGTYQYGSDTFVSTARGVPEISKSTLVMIPPTVKEREILQNIKDKDITWDKAGAVVGTFLEYKPVKIATTLIRNIPIGEKTLISIGPVPIVTTKPTTVGESALALRESSEKVADYSASGWRDISASSFEYSKGKSVLQGRGLFETIGYGAKATEFVVGGSPEIIGYSTVPYIYAGASIIASEEKLSQKGKYISKMQEEGFSLYDKTYVPEEGYRKLTKEEYFTQTAGDYESAFKSQIRREEIFPVAVLVGGGIMKGYKEGMKQRVVQGSQKGGKEIEFFVEKQKGTTGVVERMEIIQIRTPKTVETQSFFGKAFGMDSKIKVISKGQTYVTTPALFPGKEIKVGEPYSAVTYRVGKSGPVNLKFSYVSGTGKEVTKETIRSLSASEQGIWKDLIKKNVGGARNINIPRLQEGFVVRSDLFPKVKEMYEIKSLGKGKYEIGVEEVFSRKVDIPVPTKTVTRKIAFVDEGLGTTYTSDTLFGSGEKLSGTIIQTKEIKEVGNIFTGGKKSSAEFFESLYKASQPSTPIISEVTAVTKQVIPLQKVIPKTPTVAILKEVPQVTVTAVKTTGKTLLGAGVLTNQFLPSVSAVKVESALKDVETTKQTPTFRDIQIPKESSALKEVQVTKQVPILKQSQLLESISFTKQTTKQTPRPTAFAPKPTKAPLSSGSPKKIQRYIQDNFGGFEAFGKRFGKDISLGTGTKQQAGEKLTSFLKGTLGASGFIKKATGEKLRFEETGLLAKGFIKSKVSPYLVVERKSRRLKRGGQEVREISMFRKGKIRKRKFL